MQTAGKSYLSPRLCLTRISLLWETFSRTGSWCVPVKSCLWQKNTVLVKYTNLVCASLSGRPSLFHLYVNCTALCWPGCSLPERGDTENILLSCTFIWRSSVGLNSALSAQLSSSICWSSGNRNDLSEKQMNGLVKIYITTNNAFVFLSFLH